MATNNNTLQFNQVAAESMIMVRPGSWQWERHFGHRTIRTHKIPTEVSGLRSLVSVTYYLAYRPTVIAVMVRSVQITKVPYDIWHLVRGVSCMVFGTEVSWIRRVLKSWQ